MLRTIIFAVAICRIKLFAEVQLRLDICAFCSVLLTDYKINKTMLSGKEATVHQDRRSGLM